MQTTFALAALAAGVAYALPQGVTSDISPSSSAPAGCSGSYNGPFQITIINATSAAATKRDLSKRAVCGQEGLLTVTLAGGKLTDSVSRIGYIASNYQFQFDGPPQAGAIYTSGFSVCGNGSLALGGSNIFYSCYTGGFSNLYDRSWASQCVPIYINVLPCTGGSGGSTPTPAPAVSQIADGQAQATTAIPVSEFTDGQPQVITALPPVSQISDGQVQATSAVGVPVSQISDGQVQATKSAVGVPVSQISDGQVQATKSAVGVPVSQISDGQVQATSAVGVPVSQISYGQIQATKSAVGVPVSQISDGQIQATKSAVGVPVSQISDGQIQATSAVGVPVSQISDGQIQATSAVGVPVSQISDGQIQATAPATTAPVTPTTPSPASNTSTSSTLPSFTGAGNGLDVKSSLALLAGGVIAIFFL